MPFTPYYNTSLSPYAYGLLIALSILRSVEKVIGLERIFFPIEIETMK